MRWPTLKASKIAEYWPEAESNLRRYRWRKQVDMTIVWEIRHNNPVSDFNRCDTVADFCDDTNSLMA